MLFDESSILAAVGDETALSVVETVVMCVVFGFYVAVATIALYFLGQKGSQKLPVLVLFIIQTILILVSGWQFVLWNGSFLDLFFCVFMDSKLDFDQDLAKRIAVCDIHVKGWISMQGWPAYLNLLVGDVVVVWRAWALWESHSGVQWMLVILGICNGVANIVDNLYSSDLKFLDTAGPTMQLFLTNFYLILSLGLNILATMLIAYKTWIHSNTIRLLYAEGHSKRSPSFNVLVFLVESGATFCIIQAGYCTLSILASPSLLDAVPSVFATSTIISNAAAILLAFYPASVTIMSHLMLYRTVYLG
ncbi:hypothetical protein BDP27DRAFT_297355 [Rhodocollybia butyracea]|uniref:Uncharacterized protein n=1 Tax=Rhodocollybia butyracea TaxID=206335 RepID=A0A9P5U1B2_9AGAR|nr:hypothetical protein BDP27DRAFT_297355 [Rhodocollybia butyracea]